MRVLLIYLEVLDNEPIGLMYIGTVLKNEGHSVKIIGMPSRDIKQKLLKEVSDFGPDIVGISIATPMANKAEEVASIIKTNLPALLIVAGGPHPTVLPYETLKSRNIDLCVIGEGEVTTLELVKNIRNPDRLRDVKGIAFLDGDRLVSNEKREYIQDLDTLPFIDRELLPRDVIYGRAGYPLGNPCMLLITVRGCPYQCSFCQPTIDKMFGRRIRRRSPENVIQEIIELKRKYGIHGLCITDDTFSFDDRWTEKFCALMIERKLDILWYANGRLNNINKGILMKMRQAGCAGLVLTPDTGSQRVRNEVLNKGVDDDEIFKAYEVCHRIGLPVQANIMLASPTETEEDLGQSVNLIKRLQPHFMNFSYTTALPGTYLYEKYIDEIIHNGYYKYYADYDIGKFKKLKNSIDDARLISSWNYFKKMYSNASFRNRARHFLRYKYFRKILFKRWKALLFSKHPKFKHLLYDLGAIILGMPLYLKSLKLYKKIP